MNSQLSKAFEQASQLPIDQQEIFAAFLIAELNDDQAWQKSFVKSESSLSSLAKEARAEHDAGICKPLDEIL